MDELFGTTGDITAWQECARAAAVFAYGLLAFRLTSRRAFGRWAPLDIVVSIVVGSNLSRAITGNADLGGTLLATSLMLALHWLCARAAARWPAVSRTLEGSPVVLGSRGRIDSSAMSRHNISDADLQEALRAAGIDTTGAAKIIVLEPSGRISVLK
jgi:uncharacterized membrane protein YcaP (DUF421 family)